MAAARDRRRRICGKCTQARILCVLFWGAVWLWFGRTAHTPAAAAATRQASSASVKPLLRKNFLICSIVVTPICCIVYALLLGLVWDSRAGFMHGTI